MVVPCSARWLCISVLSLKNLLRSGIPRMLIGLSVLNTHPRIVQAWFSLLLLVSTRYIAPSSFFLVVSPSAIYSMIVVGVNWPVNNLCSLLMISVEGLSTTNEITSVSHEKGVSLGIISVAKTLTCKFGIILCFFHRHLPCWTKICIIHLKCICTKTSQPENNEASRFWVKG